ncbi:hypothetical protein EPI10_006738 [Gossypium australe]|uniref:Tf2-1-like SH3-like domain-containing protein n=1 Tax=Gossypium australe TaxID=47621 RepID=A0A5B6WTN7_9ROSI|nr:hypothetical protein EPI10_006738 [Gossypium australe]
MGVSVEHHYVGLNWMKRKFWDTLKVDLDRQKSYANLKRKDIKYNARDQVFMKVSPWKKVVDPVAYQLELPPELHRIHDVFHVSMLRRYRSEPYHIILIEEIEVRLDLSFEEELKQILDREVNVLRRKRIPLVKNLRLEGAMWEPEDAIHQQYPHQFRPGKFQGQNLFKEGRTITP